jgi:hypothetical protein
VRDLKKLRSLCEERLHDISVPQPFDLATFAYTVACRRGRPVQICPLPVQDTGPGLSGAWLATLSEDLIFIDPAASPWHRDLIGLHEFSHMLWDHTGGADWRAVTALVPAIAEGTVRCMLGRHGYSRAEEQEAEMTASLILERAVGHPLPTVFPEAFGMISRLADVIQHPLGHV